MLCGCLILRIFFQDRKIQKSERKVGQKVLFLTFFSYIRRVETMYNNQNQRTMNTRNKQLTAMERLYTGKHHGRHIDEDFEHDCLDGDSGEMGSYDTFDDSNAKKND